MKKLLTILVVAAAILGGFGFYMGAFEDIEVNEGTTPNMIFVYEKHIGAYEKVGSVMEELYEKAKKSDLEPTFRAGIYLDNPEETKSFELRSLVGYLVNEETEIPGSFQTIKISEGNALTAEFPYKNMGSFILGPKKVYPEMEKVLLEKNIAPLSSLEVYDMEAKKITFYMDISGDAYHKVAEEIFAEEK